MSAVRLIAIFFVCSFASAEQPEPATPGHLTRPLELLQVGVKGIMDADATSDCSTFKGTLTVGLARDARLGDSGSCLLSGGQYVDFWLFHASAGQTLRVSEGSSAFSPFLAIQDGVTGSVLAFKTDPSLSVLLYTFNSTATYIISASTLTTFKGGQYTVLVEEDPRGRPSACQNSTTAACLNNRFLVSASFVSNSSPGTGIAMALTPDTAYFWFFSSANVELVVKVVDGRAFNSRFWVFAGGLTNVDVTITVTDTISGTVKRYRNPAGTPFQPIQDTAAF